MALKVKLAMPTGNRPWTMLALRSAIVGVAVVAIAGAGLFAFYYHKYEGVVDDRLKQPLFANTAKIYAAPREVRPGQKISAHLIATELRQAGYTVDGLSHPSQMGTFTESPTSIMVHPGPESYHAPDAATIHTREGQVDSISDERGQSLSSYELEPVLITGLSADANRTKRRLLTYDAIPPNLVQAVLAIEDRKFFEHGGVNYF